MSILIAVLLGLWVLLALLMVLVIFMQRPKSEGLGAAFGGAMTENLFGAQTTNVLVKFTAWLAGFFFFITFLLSVLYAHRSMGGSSLSRELKKTAPAAAVSPAPAKPGSSIAPGTSPAAAGSPATAASPGESAPAASVAAAPQATASASVAPGGSPAAAASTSPKP